MISNQTKQRWIENLIQDILFDCKPEDIFEKAQLEEWAKEHGWIKDKPE